MCISVKHVEWDQKEGAKYEMMCYGLKDAATYSCFSVQHENYARAAWILVQGELARRNKINC